MDINIILQKVDEYYSQNKGKQAEMLMQQGIREAVAEQDNNSLLQLLNELMGYYRETSQVENSYAIAKQAISLAEGMGLADSIPYATTLLNAANAYRAGGNLEDSLACYLKVREIYNKLLSFDDMLVASFENNFSLLYQEMGNFRKAKECLLKALEIVARKEAEFEVGVTYANLASTCLQLREQEEAYTYSCKSIEIFQKLGVEDAHYGAALSAMGTYFYQKQNFVSAKTAFQQAMGIMEKNLGKNDYYYRLKENKDACERAILENKGQEFQVEKKGIANQKEEKKGLILCREYYETYGKPMIEKEFSDYKDKIAVGLVGEGSDCFGYDDIFSRDHDWGPDFCLWVTKETYKEIGEELQKAYNKLPMKFQGYQRTISQQGKGRRGVHVIEEFYEHLLPFLPAQTEDVKLQNPMLCRERVDWKRVTDASLATAINGEVFKDKEGIFSAFRTELKKGYPEKILYLKLAESMARFSQAGQYNYTRIVKRKDVLTAQIMLTDALREAMKLQHYIEGVYPPHDKWLYRSTQNLKENADLCELLEQITKLMQIPVEEDTKTKEQKISEKLEEIAAFFAKELYVKNFISDSDHYLDYHTHELLTKSLLSAKSDKELVEEIAELEFKAFDKVHNYGGRASCQNDWATFSIMRKSQYLTWNRTMLLQYLYDFYREFEKGHNLIEEKYGRMMKSTAPDEYEQIKKYFPVLSEEKEKIIEQIVQMQVNWMEEFAQKYPHLADNARSIHSSEDTLYNTSYETYLRGEISTYSDKMLELYGRYIVNYAKKGKNLTFSIMENSVFLYGYESLEAAEKFLA